MSKPITSCLIKKEYADGTQLVEFVSYASAREAEAKTGVSNGNISDCCRKKRNSAGGFFWHFTQDDLVGEHIVPRIGDKPNPFRRAVVSVSPEGVNQLHAGGSAAKRDLSELTGKKFSSGSISECCNPKHKRTHHHGYKFWFASDKEVKEFNKAVSKKRKRNITDYFN